MKKGLVKLLESAENRNRVLEKENQFLKEWSRKVVILLPVEALGLGVRAMRVCRRTHNNCVYSLVQQKPERLLGVRNCGRTTTREIQRALAKLGLKFGMTDQEIADWAPPQP